MKKLEDTKCQFSVVFDDSKTVQLYSMKGKPKHITNTFCSRYRKPLLSRGYFVYINIDIVYTYTTAILVRTHTHTHTHNSALNIFKIQCIYSGMSCYTSIPYRTLTAYTGFSYEPIHLKCVISMCIYVAMKFPSRCLGYVRC